MKTQNSNASTSKDWFKKVACVVGVTGVIALISMPVLARRFYYPPYAMFQPYAARSYPYRNSTRTIADTLAQDSKFANLVYELKEASLLNTLKEGEYTVLAPTNEAFKALSKEQYQKYSKSENRAKVLKYHLVKGLVKTKDGEVNGLEITTVEGQKVNITVTSEDTVKLNDATGLHPSTKAKNGVIIEIDKVLLPPDF